MSLSRTPAARARQLANLKRAHRVGRHGKKTALDAIPGMTEFIATLAPVAHDVLPPKAMQRALVQLARANTPAAIRLIVNVITGDGFKTRDRLFAAELILDRGFGKAPMLLALADEREQARPAAPTDRAAYATEVLRILQEAGAVLPEAVLRNNAPQQRDDVQHDDVTDAIRRADRVEVVVESIEAEHPFPRARSPIRRPGPGGLLAPPARVDEEARVDEDPLQWLFVAHREKRLSGVQIEPNTWDGLRHRLLQSADPAAGEIVAALDPRFGQ